MTPRFYEAIASTMQEIKIIQINLNRATATHDLSMHNARKRGIDLVLATEPNNRVVTSQNQWTNSKPRNQIDAATRIANNKLPISHFGSEEGIAMVEVCNITFISCYIRPRCPLPEQEEVLNTLDRVLSTKRRCIVTGDFNSKSTEWGGKITKPRGQLLSELIHKHNMLILNNGRVPTFIDVTACSDTQ